MGKRFTTMIAVAVVLLFVGGAIASAAYTSMTLSRDATINVVADDSGIIQLAPGSVSFVELVGDELAIDVTNGGANGVNVESVLKMGDSTDPTNNFAFSVTNNDQNQRTLDFAYNLNDATGVSNAHVNFSVYNSSATEVGAFSNQATDSVTLSSGEQVYVIIEVNTTSLTSSEDLSGVLEITSS